MCKKKLTDEHLIHYETILDSSVVCGKRLEKLLEHLAKMSLTMLELAAMMCKKYRIH
jgi:hypothetical protein